MVCIFVCADFEASKRNDGNIMNPAKFIREVRQESHKVTWPTRKETLVSTAMVVVLTIISAIFFLVVDNIASMGVSAILGM